jgi:hypothetical protein
MFSLYLTNQKLKLPMEVMLFDQYTIPAKFGTNWPSNSRGGMFYVGHSETRTAYGSHVFPSIRTN